MVGASLDGVPDPPAVKPQRNQNNLVSGWRHMPVASNEARIGLLGSRSHFQPGCFSFDQIFDGRGLPTTLPLCVKRQIASPPCFS